MRRVRMLGLAIGGLAAGWLGGCRDDGTALPPPAMAAWIGSASELAGLGEGEAFSFLVGGHLYGAPALRDGRPAATLRAASATLADGRDRFFVSLGDIVQGASAAELEAAREDLRALRMPVFHVPGNHDFVDPAAYRAAFGADHGCLRVGSALLVFVNTEAHPWHIADHQLVFLRRAIAWAGARAGIAQVFFFGHKNLYAVGEPRYRVLFEHGNSRDGFQGRSNFATEVRPLLDDLARTRAVFWFSGDVGVPGSLGLFVDRDPDSGVTYVATGLGDDPRDALVRVVVTASGARLEGVPLGARPPKIDARGADDWREHFARPR